MGFWYFSFFMALPIPLAMIFFGRRFSKNPPKKINSLFGYRTARSMKNMETWNFAHAYFGRLWWWMGLLLLSSSLVLLPFYHGSIDQIGTVSMGISLFQCIFLAVPIFPTERALKKKFNLK